MKILVTGADGFVASELIPKLSKHDIIALDYIQTPKPINISSEIEFINTDLSKEVPPIGDIDLIIHLATVNQLAISDSPKLVNVNITAIHNVIELAAEKNAKLIFSSSCSVYGPGLNLREDHPLNPQSLYSIGKTYEEHMIRFYHECHRVDTTILRFSNCYGDTTGIWNKRYIGKKDVIRLFMENIMNEQPISLIRDMGRDYTYIDDVIESILAMMKHKEFEIYNVGTGIETTTNELPSMVSGALGIPTCIITKPPRPTDNVIRRSLNVDKISPYWKPKTSLKEGIKKYVKRVLS